MKSSQCLHNYKEIARTDDGIAEICVICRKRYVVRIGKGEKINTKKYLKEHKRDVLQKYNKEYNKTYEYKKIYNSKQEESELQSYQRAHE